MTAHTKVIQASDPASPVQRVEFLDDDWGLVTVVDPKGRERKYRIRRRDSNAIHFPGLPRVAGA